MLFHVPEAKLRRVKCTVHNDAHYCNKVLCLREESHINARVVFSSNENKIVDSQGDNSSRRVLVRMKNEPKLTTFPFKLIHAMLPQKVLLHKKIVDFASRLYCW